MRNYSEPCTYKTVHVYMLTGLYVYGEVTPFANKVHMHDFANGVLNSYSNFILNKCGELILYNRQWGMFLRVLLYI